MAVSRPLLIALAGAVLLAVFVFATRALGGEADAPAAVPGASNPAGPPAIPRLTASNRRPPPAAPRPTPARRPAPEASVAERVTRALDEGKVVVLQFTQPRAGDDAATSEALKEVDRGKVRVFTDLINHIGDYGPLIAATGISQAPATVVIGPDRTARVLEGYQDGGTLRQAISDARR